MCGIAGIASRNIQLVSEKKLQSATACLRHRGPEAETTWINDESSVALGHLRLTIIDFGKEAAQPMHYLERYCIIHNGELYNYVEIKAQLQQKGYVFRSHSDTEVIVAAYHAWGIDCLQQFDGMFAFAIWDEKEKTLFAARDRFGEKPLFYSYADEQLLFASEIKSLWSLGVKKEVNMAMLYNFLTIAYTSNPADPQETFYRDVYKLPPASFFVYAPATNELTIEKYWTLYPEEKRINKQEAAERFRDLFSQSIKRRLRSDVSIGTSLSGGLDSSAVVAFCDQQLSDQYSHKCFTASFNDFEKDELKYAAAVAKRFGLEHFVVDIRQEEVVPLMNAVMYHQDEPISSASALAQYKVFQAAKENGVTVLLDGQGADEVLAGYHKYYKWYWQQLYRSKKLNKSKEIEAAHNLGVKEGFGIHNKIAALFPEFSAGILQSRKAKKAFHHPDLDREFAFSNKQNLYYTTPSSFDLNGALYFNTFVYGLEELLRLADRNSMAHAVEVRLPFLSHELVTFLFSLAPEFKIHNGWTKWLLRESVDNFLPEEITWRKDKLGFEPPQKTWMTNRSVQEAIQSAKEQLVKHHILAPTAAKRKIKPHTAYAADNLDWKYWSAALLFG
jgi:asparagine synthase (glutamine-hydrolysing)